MKHSRQYEWQNKQTKMGKCRICGGEPLVDGYFCNKHREQHRIRMRNRYRAKVGIPLDAPVKSRHPRNP